MAATEGLESVTKTAAEIVAEHRTGAATPEDTIAQCYARIRAHADPAIFISLARRGRGARRGEGAQPRPKRRSAARRAGRDQGQYRRQRSADHGGVPGLLLRAATSMRRAVTGLRQAGAIVIGKTNLDQFATGLVGVRSPYGVPRNPFDAKLIPGGSSSGSAVAVAAGLVPLALGTDTAGSGRMPAALNNIVGLKPSLGMVSTWGVVPACRTLDCVSVFALTVDDAMTRARRHGRAGQCRSLFAIACASAWWSRCRAACGSACRSPASASSSATARRSVPMTRRWRGSPSSAPPSSRSTSSRSTRPRGCSTRARGWPSAISRCARCWRRRRTKSIR